MKRHLLGIVFFIISLICGVYSSPLWFECTAIGSGKLANKDIGLKLYPHISSHFVMVYYSFACYRCSDKLPEASEDFHKEIGTAIEVIEIGSKFNEQGIIISERAIARFFHDETREYYYAVIWTNEKGIYRAYSSSLRHVIEFEQYVQKHY